MDVDLRPLRKRSVLVILAWEASSWNEKIEPAAQKHIWYSP
jgi:hypothetical protein